MTGDPAPGAGADGAAVGLDAIDGRLAEFAEDAGSAWSRRADGTLSVSDGEVGVVVSWSAGDGYLVQHEERGVVESDELMTADGAAVERFLAGRIGADWRAVRGLPGLTVAVTSGAMPDGARLETTGAFGWATLRWGPEEARRVATVASQHAAAELAHALPHPLDAVIASYRAPGGAPAFRGVVVRPAVTAPVTAEPTSSTGTAVDGLSRPLRRLLAEAGWSVGTDGPPDVLRLVGRSHVVVVSQQDGEHRVRQVPGAGWTWDTVRTADDGVLERLLAVWAGQDLRERLGRAPLHLLAGYTDLGPQPVPKGYALAHGADSYGVRRAGDAGPLVMGLSRKAAVVVARVLPHDVAQLHRAFRGSGGRAFPDRAGERLSPVRLWLRGRTGGPVGGSGGVRLDERVVRLARQAHQVVEPLPGTGGVRIGDDERSLLVERSGDELTVRLVEPGRDPEVLARTTDPGLLDRYLVVRLAPVWRSVNRFPQLAAWTAAPADGVRVSQRSDRPSVVVEGPDGTRELWTRHSGEARLLAHVATASVRDAVRLARSPFARRGVRTEPVPLLGPNP